MVYAKFGGQTECILGNWKIENSTYTTVYVQANRYVYCNS